VSAPERLSPLASFWPTLARAGGAKPAGLLLAERACRLTEIAARRGAEAQVAGLLLAPARAAGTVLPVAPGRWLVVSPEGSPALQASDLLNQAALVDATGAHVVLRLSGPALAAFMPAICRLDLARLRPGDAVRTPMAQVPVILAAVDAKPTYDLVIPSTFARSFAEALVHAAAAHGCAQDGTGASAPGDPAP
jgi:methylglutamate dehydrogenase subunit D